MRNTNKDGQESAAGDGIPCGIGELYAQYRQDGNIAAADKMLEKWPALESGKASECQHLTFSQANAKVQVLDKKRNAMTEKLVRMQDEYQKAVQECAKVTREFLAAEAARELAKPGQLKGQPEKQADDITLSWSTKLLQLNAEYDIPVEEETKIKQALNGFKVTMDASIEAAKKNYQKRNTPPPAGAAASSGNAVPTGGAPPAPGQQQPPPPQQAQQQQQAAPAAGTAPDPNDMGTDAKTGHKTKADDDPEGNARKKRAAVLAEDIALKVKGVAEGTPIAVAMDPTGVAAVH